MNRILAVVLFAALMFATKSFAHLGGHGEISAFEAKELAQRATQMLTFKDHGMSVGKIDPSWANIGFDQYRIIAQNDIRFIVQADNEALKKNLYFTVSKQGEVIAVSDNY